MGKKVTDQILETYNRQAAGLSEQYQTLNTEDVLIGLKERLPDGAGLSALDIACGNGRDAKWLAEQGFNVVAIDGAEGMIREARAANAHPRVQYGVDLMPELAAVRAMDQKFDLIVISAAWMHLDQPQRSDMLQTMMEIANSGAMIFISLRHGPGPSDRPMFEVNAGELKDMAEASNLDFEHIEEQKDALGRGDVWWDYVCLRMPGHGAFVKKEPRTKVTGPKTV